MNELEKTEWKKTDAGNLFRIITRKDKTQIIQIIGTDKTQIIQIIIKGQTEPSVMSDLEYIVDDYVYQLEKESEEKQ